MEIKSYSDSKLVIFKIFNMKRLKSLKEFKQTVVSLNQNQLSQISGGLTRTRWVSTCKRGCEDQDVEQQFYNPLTGATTPWCVMKTVIGITECS